MATIEPILTPFFCRSVLTDSSPPDEAVVQLLSLKKVSVNGRPLDPPRHKIIVSDGTHAISIMLSTYQHAKVVGGAVTVLDVVKVKGVKRHIAAGYIVPIICSIDTVRACKRRIGDPVEITTEVDKITEQFPGYQPYATTNPVPVPEAGPSRSTRPAPTSTVIRGARNGSVGRVLSGGGPVGRVLSGVRTDSDGYHRIADLRPGLRQYKLRVRIVRNTGGTELVSKPGSYVSNLTLQDASGKISAVAWDSEVIAKTDELEVGKVYAVSKIDVSRPDPRFAVGSPFQAKFTSATEFVALDETDKVPPLTYDFVKLKDLPGYKNTRCDVLAVVNLVGDVARFHNFETANRAPIDIAETFVPASSLVTPLDEGCMLRELQVVDSSGYACRVVLYGDEAESFNGIVGDVVMLQAVRLGQFNGLSLSMTSGTRIVLDPDIPEANVLLQWFNENRDELFIELSDAAFTASANERLSSTTSSEGLTSITDAVMNELGSKGEKAVFKTRAELKSIKTDRMSYNACRIPGCNGSVNKFLVEYPIQIKNEDGEVEDVVDSEGVVQVETKELWECRVCRRSVDEPRYCYRVEVEISDGIESIRATMFDRVAERVLGIDVCQLEALKNAEDLKFDEIITDAKVWYTFTVLARVSQMTSTVAYNITRAEPLKSHKSVTGGSGAQKV